MSNKLFLVIAALCVVLLASHTGSCEEDVDVQQPDELYILDSDSVFPTIVTDPNSPLLNIDDRITLVCYVNRCRERCRNWGYKFGRCNPQAICVCSNR